MLLNHPLVFLSGKGGVGKTTIACTLARGASKRGSRTLLVSTDPAHSTGDLLGSRLGPEPTAVEGNLHALEVDADLEAARYVDRVAADAETTVAPRLLSRIKEHLELSKGSPGIQEAALFDRVVELIQLCPQHYDRIVFDTAPTGHTLRLLALPQLLIAWLEQVVARRERIADMRSMIRNMDDDAAVEDPVLTRLRDRHDRFVAARQQLLDDALFLLILTPERLAIEETARAIETLEVAGMTPGGLIVNRVLPFSQDPYMKERHAQQSRYLDEMDERFETLPRSCVPQLPRDASCPRDLDEISAVLLAQSVL